MNAAAGVLNGFGGHGQAERFPWGKPGTASQFQRRELVAVPALRNIAAHLHMCLRHS